LKAVVPARLCDCTPAMNAPYNHLIQDDSPKESSFITDHNDESVDVVDMILLSLGCFLQHGSMVE
jgi:hypothetical protein